MKKEDAKALTLEEWRRYKAQNKNWSDSDKLIFAVKIKDTLMFKCSGDKYQHIMGWISNDPTNKLDRL